MPPPSHVLQVLRYRAPRWHFTLCAAQSLSRYRGPMTL